MIRVEISCNRCNTQLSAATGNLAGEVIMKAVELAQKHSVGVAGDAIWCNRCFAYETWLATPADKRGPTPADPCARKDR